MDKVDHRKVAFGSVLFPLNLPFFDEFISSLKKQSYLYFDLLVVNDGVVDIENIFSKWSLPFSVIFISSKGSPAKNREALINFSINNNYDVIIFGDSDDFFSQYRVEVVLDYLFRYDIVVNDLDLVKNSQIFIEKNRISKRIKNGTEFDFSDVSDKNFCGLSNLAINVKGLYSVDLNDKIIALDWYLVSILLLEGRTAVFTNEAITYYRQHHYNLVGLGQPFDVEMFKKVRCMHFNFLKDKFPLDKRVDGAYQQNLSVLRNLNEDSLSLINNNRFWWEI